MIANTRAGVLWRVAPHAVGLSFVLVAGLCLSAERALSLTAQTNSFVGSQTCKSCHPRFYELWSTSFHGLAMQPWTQKLASEKLLAQTNAIRSGTNNYAAVPARGVVLEWGAGKTNEYSITQVAGGKNIFYFLTPLERGKLQVLPVAYDVRRKEWFDTTASAMRHFTEAPDQALDWRERPLTFNTSCYNCHVSQLEKNYDLKTDSYHTVWREPGISCETCHGPSADHVTLFSTLPTNAPPPKDVKLIVTSRLSTSQRNDMCAPCHAKMSPLTDSFTPGQKYFDHFDLVTLEDRDFHPDGRDLGENYTWTQWRMNPCAKVGKLDCMHCHTSSGRYRFSEPAKANNACLPCHEETVAKAAEHSHHPAGTPGSQCISCHMPVTEFARMRRSDHSFLPPTPAATLEFKSPNACNICHTNDAAWADKYVREWHSKDYQKPVLERARLIDSARKGQWKELPNMLAYLQSDAREEVQSTSLVRLLANCDAESKWPVIRSLLQEQSPLVRASAAEALGGNLNAANVSALLPSLTNEYRLVRLRAAAALANVPEDQLDSTERAQLRGAISEYVASLQARPDDMASHYNLGNFHMAQGRLTNAVYSYETAIRLRPDALPPHVNAALAYSSLGQNNRAESLLRAAVRLEPTNSVANLNLGMLLAELGNIPGAEDAFRKAFAADPRSAQAAYNLGILLSKRDMDQAIEWSAKAAKLSPQEPRFAYTLAFFQHSKGRRTEATRTLEESIARTPAHPDSYALLGQIFLSEGKLEQASKVYERAAFNPALPQELREQFLARARQLTSRR